MLLLFQRDLLDKELQLNTLITQELFVLHQLVGHQEPLQIKIQKNLKNQEF